jgi:hypothetical protein
LEATVVLRTGIVNPRFVASKHARPWLLNSFDIKRNQRENVGNVKWMSKDYSEAKHVGEMSEIVDKINWNHVKMINVQIRPWVKINGRVNFKILHQIMTSLFSYIMMNPGAKLTNVCRHFQVY